MSATDAAPTRDLQPLLAPRSIAMVGASEGSNSGRCLQSLAAWGFDGPLYPVNPRREEVYGRRCYPALTALPAPVECAAIAVPAAQVLPVLRDCVAAGVRAAVVHSSGFAGFAGGPRGLQMQDEVAAFAREHGLMLGGPNCQGTIAVRERVALYFSTVTELAETPRPGGLGLVSHSGSLMSAVFRFGARRGLGFSYLVSSGNEIDVTAADYLAYMLRDPATRAVAAILEQFRDLPAFAATADLALAAGKPLLVLKVGRTEASRRAIRSHTGALAEAADVAEAFCRDRGIVLVDSLDELYDVALGFQQAGAAVGPRLGVISPSGGTGCLVADAATRQGLELPELDAATVEAVRAVILPVGTAANPADLSGPHLPALAATLDLFAAHPSLETLVFAHSYATNSLLDALPGIATGLASRAPATPAGPAAASLPPTTSVPPTTASPPPTAPAATGPEPGTMRPLFALFATDAGVEPAWERAAGAPGLVLLRGLEPGLRVIRTLVDYRERQEQRERGTAAACPLPRPRAPATATRVASLAERQALLARLGVDGAPLESAATADAAIAVARRLGYPVALKLEAPSLAHKSDAGGVLLGLRDDEEVRRAFAALQQRAALLVLAGEQPQVVVQPMIEGGVELILGAHLDPHFGMLVLCGLGGIYAETMQDVAIGFPPLGDGDAERLLASLRGYPLLAGARGRPPADVAAAARALTVLSHVVLDGGIESLDVNPLIVLPVGRGAVAVDSLLVVPA